MSHAFVKVAGYGMRILPKAPYVLVADDATETLDITGLVGDEEQRVLVQAGDALNPALGQLVTGPSGGLCLEVGGVYQVPWPAGGLALISAPQPAEPPFYMFSDLNGGLVYVQGPMPRNQVPSRAAMLGSGQRQVGQGETESNLWVEMAYDHDDVEWHQLHIIADFSESHGLVVTTQALADNTSIITHAAHAIAQSVVPYSAVAPNDGP